MEGEATEQVLLDTLKNKCFVCVCVCVFRLQPLGLVSDPTVVSNACLGIVSGEQFITMVQLSTLWRN